MSKRQHARTQKVHVDQYAAEARRPNTHKSDRPDSEETPWAVDQESRQQSIAAHARGTHMKGQNTSMRVKRSNQPRHGG